MVAFARVLLIVYVLKQLITAILTLSWYHYPNSVTEFDINAAF